MYGTNPFDCNPFNQWTDYDEPTNETIFSIDIYCKTNRSIFFWNFF